MTLAAIVLAAGHARRFGGDKLGAEFRGEPLLSYAIAAARAAPVETVTVVCREPLEQSWPGSPPVSEVRIASEALSDSLRAGIAAAGSVDGAFIFLGDMPLVPHGFAAMLAAALGDNFAALPRCHGLPGHPVLLSSRAFAELATLKGDAGAGRLLRARPEVAWIDTDEEGVLLDVDRQQDIARLSGKAPRRD